jgi:hypothetical protein
MCLYLEVLRGVLYPEAHGNGIKKKKKEGAIGTVKGEADFSARDHTARPNPCPSHVSLRQLLALSGGRTSKASVRDTGRNATTRSVFQRQEIVQPTTVEQESFSTWKVCTVTPFKVDSECLKYVLARRTFSIWTDWA